MLPSDITGVSMFNVKTREFEFRPGPIHAQIVLVDEINRATPKTQSALLEAMEERQVTVDGHSYLLEPPFMVLATQNPIEYEGTFPLPEAQLDRLCCAFVWAIRRRRMRSSFSTGSSTPIQWTRSGRWCRWKNCWRRSGQSKTFTWTRKVKDYIVEIVRRTREHPDVYLGSSSRGALAIYRLGQARAALLRAATSCFRTT
jgi:MoxR-like ATPase